MADEVKIEINVDAVQDMPIESLELLERAQEGSLKAREMLDLLDGFVVGGVRGRGLKVRDMQRITAAINAAFQQESRGEVGASS